MKFFKTAANHVSYKNRAKSLRKIIKLIKSSLEPPLQATQNVSVLAKQKNSGPSGARNPD